YLSIYCNILTSINTVVIFLFLRLHLFLHFFPTRRSSDLILCHMFFLFRPYFFHSKICDRREWIYPPCNRRALGSKGFRESGNIRSEEHTSELQSRFDLVCRLLLEKKKEITENTLMNTYKI